MKKTLMPILIITVVMTSLTISCSKNDKLVNPLNHRTAIKENIQASNGVKPIRDNKGCPALQ